MPETRSARHVLLALSGPGADDEPTALDLLPVSPQRRRRVSQPACRTLCHCRCLASGSLRSLRLCRTPAWRRPASSPPGADELAVIIERTSTIITQARARLAGQIPDGATRLVSLHDPGARPIRKGRTGRPAGFGYKAQVTGNDDGIIAGYNAGYGAAPDGPQLAPAVQRVSRRSGRVPRAVTADRGYGQSAVERDLQELGVRTVAIPRQATDLTTSPFSGSSS